MTELRLCENCTIELVEQKTSDLVLGDSRTSVGKVCDCCSAAMRYEYVFTRVSPLQVAQMESL